MAQLPIIASYIVVAILGVWSLLGGNFEFLFYTLTTFILTSVIAYAHKRYTFPTLLVWGYVVWMVSHVFGGLYHIGDHVLYSQMLLPIIGDPYSVLKYDQVVHAYCYFIITLLLWHVIVRVVHTETLTKHRALLVALVVFAAAGTGALNEVIEFIATISFTNVNVGGYENTLIDIISNFLGSLLAVPLFKPRS